MTIDYELYDHELKLYYVKTKKDGNKKGELLYFESDTKPTKKEVDDFLKDK